MMILQQTRGALSSGDQCSLDLPFAETKSLAARIGPTPTFTRASSGTYFGPLVTSGGAILFGTTGIQSGRAFWQYNSDESDDYQLYYTGTMWELRIQLAAAEDPTYHSAAAGSEWRPDQANWSGSGVSVTTSSTFGIVRSAINEPRFDHNTVTPFACKGLLIEEQRTNLMLQSSNFASASWAIVNATVSADATTSPDGLTTADKLINVNTAIGRIQQGFALTGAHTMSIFAKAGEWNWILLSPLGAGTGCWFNVSNGTVGTKVSGYVGSITPLDNGWYRCSVSFTGAGASTTARIIPTNADNTSTNGNGTSGIFIWGAQLEAGAFTTSYIPTTTASVIRSADVCSITGSNFSGFYNQSEGSLACNYAITAGFTGNRYAASIEDTTGGTQNGFSFRNTNSSTSFIAGGGYTSVIGSVTTGVSKHILAYTGLTEFVYCKNGVVGTTAGSGTRDPSLPIRMSIGSLEGSNAFTLCGHISSIRYFKKRLPNAKLQAITV